MGMGFRGLPLFLLCATAVLRAQTTCPATPLYSPCDIVFELNDAEAAAHPNPYVTVDIRIEFRSPRHRTYLLPAFWDGGRRMVVRFSPTEAGDWVYRVSGNIQRFENVAGQLSATAIENPAVGFIRTANMHHFAHTDDNKNVPHLWTGDTSYRFAFVDPATFQQVLHARAKQRCNHLRGAQMGGLLYGDHILPPLEHVDTALLRKVDERALALTSQGIVADL